MVLKNEIRRTRLINPFFTIPYVNDISERLRNLTRKQFQLILSNHQFTTEIHKNKKKSIESTFVLWSGL